VKIYQQNQSRLRRHAMTLVEMMVATALLVVIMLGLTMMFNQTQRDFLGGLKQVDVLEGGRAVMDVLARDLESMSDAGSSNVVNLTVFRDVVNDTIQTSSTFSRTNELDYLFALSHANSDWIGTGYSFSNAIPGVASLCRFTISTNSEQLANNFLLNRFFKVYDASKGNNATFLHRIADGIVHFKVRALDENGIEFLPQTNSGVALVQFPISYSNSSTNLPNFLEIELGILEPQTLKQAASLPPALQADYLKKQAGKVHIFRQQIPIRNAPR